MSLFNPRPTKVFLTTYVTINFLAGYCLKGSGGRAVPKNYEEPTPPRQGAVKPVTSSKDETQGDEVVQEPVASSKVETQDGEKDEMASRPLLYHVRDPSTKRNVLASIITLRKHNPDDRFVMKTTTGRTKLQSGFESIF